MKVAIVGAGWAGLAAAVAATQAGHHAIVFEASHAIGGRARGLKGSKNTTLPNGQPAHLDNGQHILIGAYTDTLALMRAVGVQPEKVLLNLPMALRFPDGQGIEFNRWPTPLDALAGMASARGWSLRDKAVLLRHALGWQLKGFACPAQLTVAQLCQRLTPRVLTELIEPLCVSALNTPAHSASAEVFLRVLRDALFGVQGGSRLLLPTVDLSALFPEPAAAWLVQHGGQVRLGRRVHSLQPAGAGWQVEGEVFDALILANAASNMALALDNTAKTATYSIASKLQQSAALCQALRFEAITTVYAWAATARLSHPMLALRSSTQAPAQFVFDRGQLGGAAGLLAFVVSASSLERAPLQAQVLAQAQTQLGLPLQAVQTVVEKRATFACTPALQHPAHAVAPGLWLCGDHVQATYPATLEGAVRSGLAAAQGLGGLS
ncbi:hydroxysqualene dehydroxylase HpnE [Rhodoferax sp.]|uniref:hydroxysqualene dehydroxylase HpnE n=1 Tax=Rhodoferax sp. TaxID=50421 RepID=UPI002618C26E|nr:hydroxysqualene dehydroxylase HpnE [Rhodoferax sp.]MDD2808830.1 hydroxysqualene dehydroxylase HpnE [Rhodoferax sp.]